MPATAIVPSGPYTYDDPRFIYNEPCMFYNGGFDLQCLIDIGQVTLPKKIWGGRSTGGLALKSSDRPYKEKDCRVILDFEITARAHSLNGKLVDSEEISKKYHLDYEPIEVSVDELKHKIDNYEVFAQALTASITTPVVCNTDKIKLLPIKTIVSSSLESQIRKSKILFKAEVFTRKKKK